MRTGITIDLSPADRQHLAAIVADRDSPQKHAWRARIILLTADGCGTAEIMRRAGVNKCTVWRWQQRFMAEGLAGLLRDQTRHPGTPPLGREIERRVVARMLIDPPRGRAHWTAAAMARSVGISSTSVTRIWRKHQVRPLRARPEAAPKLPRRPQRPFEIVGLHVVPPVYAVVLSVDPRHETPAAGGADAVPPMLAGHDLVDTLDGRCGDAAMLCGPDDGPGDVPADSAEQQDRCLGFLEFLDAVEAAVPAGKLVEALVNNDAAREHPGLLAWLERHPRWAFHMTATPADWRDALQGLAALVRRRLRLGAMRAIDEIQSAAHGLQAEEIAEARYIQWTGGAG